MFRPGFHRVLDPSETAPCPESRSQVCLPSECATCGHVSLKSAPRSSELLSREIQEILHASKSRPKKLRLPRPSARKQETVQSQVEKLVDEPIDWTQIDRSNRTSLVQCIERFVLKHIDPDICVNIGKHTIKCHSLILQCYSKYFKKHKYGDTVYLPEDKVSPEAFMTVYKWMKLPHDCAAYVLTRRNVLDMVQVAQYLGISALEEQCWAFIDSPLVFNEETALLLFIDERAQHIASVREILVSRIRKVFLPFTKTARFKQLPKDILCNLISSSYILVHGEMEVFLAACRWLLYDWRHRKEHFTAVMKCVRFGLMPAWLVSAIHTDQSNPRFHAALGDRELDSLMGEALAYAEYRSSRRDVPGDWVQLLGLQEPHERNWIGIPEEEDCRLTNSLWDEYIAEQSEWAAADRESRLEPAASVKSRRPKKGLIQ